MRTIRNLKIKTKFIIILVLSALSIGIVGGVGIYTLNSTLSYTTDEFTDISQCLIFIKNLDFNFSRQEIYLRNYVLTADPKLRETSLGLIREFAAEYTDTLQEYKKQLEDWEWTESVEYETLMTVGAKYEEYEKLRDKVINLADEGKQQEVVAILDNEIESLGTVIDGLNKILYDTNESDTATTLETSQEMSASSEFFILAFSLFMIVILMALVAVIASLIIKPVIAMSEAAKKMAMGDLEVQLGSNSKDEVSVLSNNMLTVKNTLHKIIDDITIMSENQKAGNLDFIIDESIYEGSFKAVTSGINAMSADNVSDIKKAMNCVEEMGYGNFDFDVPSFPGEKEFIHKNIEHVKNNLKNVNHEISRLVQNAAAGNLSERSDTSSFGGDWLKIIEGINNLLDSITKPLEEASAVLKEMSEGNLSGMVVGDYKGNFKELKDSINITSRSMVTNVSAILDILETLANKNPNLNISVSRDYSMAFASIKNGLQSLISIFSSIMVDITSASSQVDAGSKQVSESSYKLSENSTTQANSVLELTNAIDEITAGINQTNEHSKTANQISIKTTKSVADGNTEMNNLLEAMENIRNASNKVVGVVKAIDDIAFQTNLLALNAAVEAARAGQHGKGFAVVADEVRNLANRSKQAAGETTELVKDSIEKVGDGSKIVKSTAAILSAISEDTTVLSGIINGISNEAEKQAETISSVNANISRISESTSENTASAQETAAISEELLSQSSMLSELVSKYSL